MVVHPPGAPVKAVHRAEGGPKFRALSQIGDY